MLTVLVDYDSGNLHSAAKAFQRMAAEVGGGEILISARAQDVLRADRIVLPGDGAFPACRQALDAVPGLFGAIAEAVTRRAIPFLGICVGMQMMASWGREYQSVKGFDWVPGEVTRIQSDDPQIKVPHMGWNDLHLDAAHPVLAGLKTGDHAYFVHSYQFRVADPAHLLAHVDYAGPVTAIIARDNMVGTQFHPEKSQQTGLRLIANFLTWRP